MKGRIVEVCIFRYASDRVEYLLLKRSATEPLYPDLWQLVTGSTEGEERALDAALRELREETSLRPSRLWIVPFASTFYDPTADLMQICPLFAVQVEEGCDPILSEEHCAFEWLPYIPARSRLVWPGQRDGLDVVDRVIVRGGEAAARLAWKL